MIGSTTAKPLSRAQSLALILCLSFFASCQQKAKTTPTDEDPTNLSSPFDQTEVSPAIDNSSSLSSGDKEGLNNLADEFEDVAPADDDSGVSAALAAEMKRLLEEEKAGHDVSLQKIALAGKMMAECAKKASTYAPVPGQPLEGNWKGQNCPTVQGKYLVPSGPLVFDIDDPANLGPGKGRHPKAELVFVVKGASAGQMSVDKNGNGNPKTPLFSGVLQDNGLGGRSGAGTVQVVNPRCNVGVGLEASRNPIPENFVEGTRKLGKCFRTTLVLMSPSMDEMFKKMDPQLASVLKAKMLGIQ